MDSHKVWQWRIMHVKKYSLHTKPFLYSNKIGLNFNVASNTEKKLHLKLLTNGVILEVCDFAKTVNMSKMHFITNILENNFDLGLENEQQRIDFTARILHKVRELIRNPPGDKHEAFSLFDTSAKPECNSKGNSGLNTTSMECNLETFPMETDDTDDSDEDEFKCLHDDEMDREHTDDSENEDECECSGGQAKDPPSSFPYCEEFGLNLDFGSKQSLDPHLFTKGAMLELVHFTKVLTSSYSRIIVDVLEHNFDLDLKNKHVKHQVLFQISHLLKRRKHFQDETFSILRNPLKRPMVSTVSNVEVKRLRRGQSKNFETNTFSQHTKLCNNQKAEENHYCSFVQGESDLNSDSENFEGQSQLQSPRFSLSFDTGKESESNSTGVCAPLLPSDTASSLKTIKSNTEITFSSQQHKKGLCGGEEKTLTPGNVFNEHDINREDIETGKDLWKLRSNRVEQIISALDKEFCRFKWFQKFSLEFNVGFGPKQNISVDSLENCALLKIAKFALAMNASRQDFIMEILEHNFDLDLQTQHQRDIFTCKIMDKVRRLKYCENLNEVFEPPRALVSDNMASQSADSAKSDDATVCPPDSHTETEECVSYKGVDLYPKCKEIGLKLHVNNSQPNKKLEINKLTNGAMLEVTNFAETLCGTFEQICLDVFRHNLDIDFQSGDLDFARNILAKIQTAKEQKNLFHCYNTSHTTNGSKKYLSSWKKLYYRKNPNLDACSAGSSQASMMDQSLESSVEIKYVNEIDLKLWKLRANQIQRILSVPHEEHCPLYSYARCKKLGIDFNVGSGIKQNLDLKLLTNGVMAEFYIFAAALDSATKHFVTEILEHNFHLNLKKELRSVFGLQVLDKIRVMKAQRRKYLSGQKLFELPDVTCLQEPADETALFCPKCDQDRNDKLYQYGCVANHMHRPHPYTLTDTVSSNMTAQTPAKNPSSTFSSTEEDIMDKFPSCKKIGLSLCVDYDQPKNKLDKRVLTLGIMNEVADFAQRLCGAKNKILHTLLEHNFNIDKHIQNIDLIHVFRKLKERRDGGHAWFNEVFVLQPICQRLPGQVSKLIKALSLQKSEKKETIKKRQLALQTKKGSGTLPNQNTSDVQAKRSSQSTVNCYPICTEMGLELDVTSKSSKKEKLDLKLLTNAVVLEIHKFATKKRGQYYPRTVFDILDCNFDLSSQHYRRWQFSIDTASKVRTMVKQYGKELGEASEVFKLPFVFDPRDSQRFLETTRHEKSANSTLDIADESESGSLGICGPVFTSSDVSCDLPTVNSNVNPPGNVPKQCDIEQDITGTENYYTCPLGEPETESDEETDSAGSEFQFQISERCILDSDVPREPKSSCLGIPDPVLISSDVSSSLKALNSNMDPLCARQLDVKELCVDGQQTHPQRNTQREFELEEEDMGTENMWKLRSNRVEQILSALNEEFGPFVNSKKVGLEYNVGFGPKQNININSITNTVLLEVAKFVLAINSSQKDFIMEILEYNFDLDLQSQHHRNTVAWEIMTRIRHLKGCEDAVKLSDEVFELPRHLASRNISVDSAIPYFSRSLRKEKDNAVPVCRPDSNAETEEHEELYPKCKEIGLKLIVNNSQPNKKLEMDNLTNGAMLEVSDFAEKLCGTFEQLCLDILRHNLHCDLQSEDSDVARSIFARIPEAVEQRKLSTSVKGCKTVKCMRKANFFQATGSFADVDREKQLNLILWKLRANQIEQILSAPHEEHCPLYSYSRCKKLGIDFNVGSGVKQNLEIKSLTNGVMVEFFIFAAALVSATKHFVAEMLEYNFNLDLKDELCRATFGQQIVYKVKQLKIRSVSRVQHFELPDMTSIQEPTYNKLLHCPKCYQERKLKLCQDKFDVGHMNHPVAMTETVPPDADCILRKALEDLSPACSAAEAEIMERYPYCKKIGLSLCVDKDRPKDKLDTHVLTRTAMKEVVNFAQYLCGTINDIICELFKHNFNTAEPSQELEFVQMFRRATAQKEEGPNWFNESFVMQSVCLARPEHVSRLKLKEAPVMHSSERKEAIKNRKLALQMKEERATLPNYRSTVVKTGKGSHRGTENCYTICAEIGLDLDVTSKSGEKEKLDLKLLTTAVVMEIHKFVTQKIQCYYPSTLFDILDYNFDLSSEHHRRWEFSLSTACKVQALVKRYRRKPHNGDEVFRLPFAFPHRRKKKCTVHSEGQPLKKRNVAKVVHHSDDVPVDFISGSKTGEGVGDDKIDLCTRNMQMSRNVARVGCGSPLQENMPITEEYDSYHGDVKLDLEDEAHYDDVKMESNTWDGEHLVPGEPAGSFGCTSLMKSANSIKTESQSELVQYHGEPEVSACPNIDSGMKPKVYKADGHYLIPIDPAAVRTYYATNMVQANESALNKKEDQIYVPFDSYNDGVESYTQNEIDIILE